MDLVKRKNFWVAFIVIVFIISLMTSCERLEPGLKTVSPEIKGEHIKILFVGDTSYGENYSRGMKITSTKGYDYSMQKLAGLLNGSDFVIANLETPITDLKESPYQGKKTYCHFTSPEHTPKHLKKYNIHTVCLANNHGMDFAMPGLEQTLQVLKENNMEWFGAGLNEAEASLPFVKTFQCGQKPFKMSVIGAFEYSGSYDRKYSFYAKDNVGGVYRLSKKAIQEQISQIKKEDPETFVVLYPHWGGNYAWKNDKQTKNAYSYIQSGADIVIGHGGHGMQEIEYRDSRWILYGLGNFMFLSRGRYGKKNFPPYSYGAQLICEQEKGKLKKRVRLYPIVTDNTKVNYQPRTLDDKEFKEFVRLLVEKSPLSKKDRKRLAKGKSDIGHFVELQMD